MSAIEGFSFFFWLCLLVWVVKSGHLNLNRKVYVKAVLGANSQWTSMQRHRTVFFEDIFWVKFSQMIKTKADGHSEANTPLTHILSIYLFDSVVFLPPSVIIWKRSWWPLLLITSWHLGATVVLSTAAAEAPPTVRGFDVRAARPLPPDAGWNFLRDRLLRSARGVHRRARQRHVGRCSFVFSRWTTRNTPTRAGWHHGGHFTADGHSHAKTPRRQAVAGPMWDVAECRALAFTLRSSCKRTRVATPQRKARNPKATSLLPNAPTIRCFYCMDANLRNLQHCRLFTIDLQHT